MTHPAAGFAATATGRVNAACQPEPGRRGWSGTAGASDRCLSVRCLPPPAVADAKSPKASKSVFYSGLANFLESGRTRFHYSVIRRTAKIAMAAGRPGRHLLNDEVSASALRGDSAGAERIGGRRQRPDARSDRLWLRTGRRKMNTNDRGFADTKQIHIPVANTGMTQSGENIHATSTPYATVAPMLQDWVRASLADRGTTPSTGAADADGR